MLIEEATNTNFIVFGLIRLALEPTIYRTRDITQRKTYNFRIKVGNVQMVYFVLSLSFFYLSRLTCSQIDINRHKKKHVHIRSNPGGRIYTNRQKYQHGSHIRQAKTIILRTLFENSRFNKYINVLLQVIKGNFLNILPFGL